MGEFHRQPGYVMRIEGIGTSGSPMRARYALAVGFQSSTHDASRLRCLKSAPRVAPGVTHATFEIVALRNTSPRGFGFRVALRDTADWQSEQSRYRGSRQKSQEHRPMQPREETTYA
jgi:hypothetical protein